jgi:hypothetical protein
MRPEAAAQAERLRVRVPRLSRAAAVTLASTGLMIGGWILMHIWFFGSDQIIDTPTYQRYGEALLGGQVPYRDYRVEYPPGALPAFVLPAAHSETLLDYRYWFDALMLLCAVLISGFVAATLTALGASRRRLYLAATFVAVGFLALGSVVYSRFDLWPALLVTIGVGLIVTGPVLAGLAAFGLAVAAKLYALVLLPPALSFVWRTRGRRVAIRGLGVFALVVLAVFLPFLVLAPDGVWDSLHRQASRPLQLESLGSALLLSAHQLGAYTPSVVKTFGSDNLVGSLPTALATVLVVLQVLAIVGVWILFHRGEPSAERFVTAAAAAITAFVAFGKVLSPQFLIWIVPLVALLAGRTGRWAAVFLGAALVLTQIWFPHRYWDLHDLGAISWVVLARDLSLVGLFGLLAASLRVRGRAQS